MRKFLLNLIETLGYKVTKFDRNSAGPYADIQDKTFWEFYRVCQPYTMTSVERMFALYQATNYVIDQKIPGDFVECGVWRGGSSLMVAQVLQHRGVSDRHLYLYDTFEGMSEPTAEDVDFRGQKADQMLEQTQDQKETSVWCLANLDDVKLTMSNSAFPAKNIHYVEGKVEDTIPKIVPAGAIALLRLDTDWYTSTKHELIHLYPSLSTSGILIIDDYGHWEGCRKAVDEYFTEQKTSVLLQRIDYTGRLAIKK
jgi:O-methyltransferase